MGMPSRSMFGLGLSLVLLLVSACADDGRVSPPPPPPMLPATPTGSAAGPEAPEDRVVFRVEDGTVASAVQRLAEASDTVVVLDPSAVELAECLRITVATPGPRPADELFTIVGSALEGTGLRLERTPAGVLIRREEGVAPPERCLPEEAAAGGSTGGTGGAAGARTPAQSIEGIRAHSATELFVTRAALARLTQDQTALRSARIVPHVEDGRPVGLKLYGIRAGSPLSALGLQNGDLVRSVDGHDLGSPEAALEAYARIRSRDRHTVVLERRGRRMALTYRIVDRLPPR